VASVYYKGQLAEIIFICNSGGEYVHWRLYSSID
jgi:hypothetical protein